ncbi:MAG: thioredoxin family protein [Bacteroidales bacterium]|nr:thioredoxin family protein [Bacteroidales bacterium]
MKRAAAISLTLFCAVSMMAQGVSWSASSVKEGDLVKVTFTASVPEGLHIYGPGDGYNTTSVRWATPAEPAGPLEAVSEGFDFKGETVYSGKVEFTQKIAAASEDLEATVSFTACDEEGHCGFPEEAVVSVPAAKEKSSRGLWKLILEAILWGLAMLLTPCVFPMVPMTVSFFLKSESSPAAGRRKAFAYGLFIVLLYTLPISVIILLTRLLGGDAVTADIFNWLSTHWLPNLLFFVIFMVFAASFFGAFEITLPSKWTDKADKGSDRKGLAGVFFMALTLVLVSFSCTGPIVGSVLIRSTGGEFWVPMATMLAFSVAFALPFTVLAMFPSLLKKVKSGSWLGSVKVVLGFIEVALGLKFLSVADQTYHWGILDREIYLAIWIVDFTLLGLYLLGKITFKKEEKTEKISLFRFILAGAVFTFVVYMIPGMFGAPLKALSGYLPPLETQDFVIGRQEVREAPSGDAKTITIAHGLQAWPSVESGLEAAAESGKPVFVDVTGYGCVNCREMEERVWSDPEVLGLLRERFEIVALHTDDKAKLPEDQWVRTDGGKVLKDVGRVNSEIARKRFGVNSQPSYIILSPDGEQIAPVRSYNLDIEGFRDYLRSAL